jgi:UDP-N-acetylglucosamine acyltransferase
VTTIHPTAEVDPAAELDDGVVVGPYCRLGPKVRIGPGTRLESYVIVDGDTTIGKGCRLFSFVVIGTEPQDVKYKGEHSSVVIGDGNILREFVTVNRASNENGVTTIGNNNFLMTYVHIAHNCIVRNNVVLANAANVAGYVLIDDYAFVGGVTPVHQFVRIGRHSIIGGGCRVPQDVPPFVRAAGNPLRAYGLNSLGLRRRGFPTETELILKKAYRILYRSGLNTKNALARVEAELEQTVEIRQLVDFIRGSRRGLIGGG